MAATGHDISGGTRLAAVVGHPVRHSLSPRIHNAAFAAAGLDWAYVALDVDPDRGADVVEAMRTLGIDGLSVTMPHKAGVAEAADERTETADKLGVANCLFWRDGRIVADSTDGDGFIAAFEHRFGSLRSDQTVGVIGAGGAACSIIEALGRRGVHEIVVVNRSVERLAAAVPLADQARPGREPELAAVDIIVNATSIGMADGDNEGRTPMATELISSSQTVVDIVYNPLRTPLLMAAAERGASTDGGVAMLVHQAALAFERWTGQPAPVDAMTAAVADHLA